jgi:hypothetical protein
MRNTQRFFLFPALLALFLASCATYPPKQVAYPGMYAQKPTTILVMPPINRSTNVEAKEFFYSTLSVPLDNAGYYVYPPFMTLDILKNESAYDSENFLESNLTKFHQLLGADVVLFTVIKSWNKSVILGANVTVEIEYIIKSATTNEVLYHRQGKVIVDESVQSSGGGLGGLIADIAVSALKTALTDYTQVARAVNKTTLADLPLGKYDPKSGADGKDPSGPPAFTLTVRSADF